MNEQPQERVESAIIQLIAEFPGLLGPVAIQAALKKVFGLPDEKAAGTGQELIYLQTIGLISSQDLGKGRFVYRLTNRGAQWLGSDRVRIQPPDKVRPNRAVPAPSFAAMGHPR